MFKNLGAQEYRAKYAQDERTIYVNLDHPQIAAAKGLADIDEGASPLWLHRSLR